MESLAVACFSTSFVLNEVRPNVEFLSLKSKDITGTPEVNGSGEDYGTPGSMTLQAMSINL